MKTIGLTGGIGVGKTTISKIFKQLGVPIYNSDDRAKFLMNHSETIKTKLKELIGNEAYLNNELNRAFIAKKVFGNKDLLDKLNQIVHPAVSLDFNNWVAKQSSKYVLKEAAIIYEQHLDEVLDAVIVVTAPEELRIERVMMRDNISREEVLARISKQMPQAEKDNKADYLIFNDENHRIIDQVKSVHEKIIKT